MITRKRVFIVSTTLLLGFGIYRFRKFQSAVSFQSEVFDKSRFRKVSLYDVHQRIAFDVDPALDDYEKEKNIGSIRKELLKHAKGFILETATGTSRNMPFYPEGSKILATDWASNMLEVSLSKLVPKGIEIDYKIEDSERMTFKNDVFDTVVDTFGLEAYVNPVQALKEMKRVCKKDGKILILTSGKGEGNLGLLNKMMEARTESYLRNYGYFPSRDWDPIIKAMDFEIEKEERWFNGTLYMYVLKNNK